MEKLEDDEELSVYSFGYFKHGQTGTDFPNNSPFRIAKFDCNSREGVPIQKVSCGGNKIIDIIIFQEE